MLQPRNVLCEYFVDRGGDQGQKWVEKFAHWCIVGCCDIGPGYTFVLPRWADDEWLESGSKTSHPETTFERSLQVPQIDKMRARDEHLRDWVAEQDLM